MHCARSAVVATGLAITLMVAGPVVHAAPSIDVPNPRIQDWSVEVLQVADPADVAITTQINETGATEFQVSFQVPVREPDGATAPSPQLGVIYNLLTWDTAADGVIRQIDVAMDLHGLESSFVSQLAGRVMPAVKQGGTVYGHVTSIVDVYAGAQDTRTWSIQASDQWWRDADGHRGFDPLASGPIQFGFIWSLSTTCATDEVCTTVTALNNFAFDVVAAPVPEPASWMMLLAGLGLVGRRVLQRPA